MPFAADGDLLESWARTGGSLAEIGRLGLIASGYDPNAVVLGVRPPAPRNSTREEAEAFVSGLYRTLLGREPDAGGLRAWAGLLETGRQTPGQVAQGFLNSSEYAARQRRGDTMPGGFTVIGTEGDGPNYYRVWRWEGETALHDPGNNVTYPSLAAAKNARGAVTVEVRRPAAAGTGTGTGGGTTPPPGAGGESFFTQTAFSLGGVDVPWWGAIALAFVGYSMLGGGGKR